jgi:hypothetical protein
MRYLSRGLRNRLRCQLRPPRPDVPMWATTYRLSLTLFGFGRPCNSFDGTTFVPITESYTVEPSAYLAGGGAGI